MTILYRPVKIETAKQAEELPEGTIAYKHHSDTSPSILPSEPPTSWVARSTAAKAATNWWLTGGHSRPDVDMIGWTALVPVEVKEESRGAIVRLQRTDDAPWGPDEVVEYRIDDYGVSSWEAISGGRIYGRDITGEMEEWLSAQPKETRLVTPWEKS